MRKLYMTDIHGEYAGMQQLLDYASYIPAVDQLVIGGDMVSRGKDSGPVLKEVRRLSLLYPNQVKIVIGNHEEMMGWHYEGKSKIWLSHAGNETIRSIKQTFNRENELQDLLKWTNTLPLIVEDEEYIYTHAGINPYVALEEQDREILWMSEFDFYSYPRPVILECTGGKPIIHGHTPCEFIYFDGARMNCDLGAHTYAIEEERALGLVDLSNRIYYVYKTATGKILERKIAMLNS